MLYSLILYLICLYIKFLIIIINKLTKIIYLNFLINILFFNIIICYFIHNYNLVKIIKLFTNIYKSLLSFILLNIFLNQYLYLKYFLYLLSIQIFIFHLFYIKYFIQLL